jgi:hypothetical protein
MEETPIFHGLQIFPAIQSTQWTWASLKLGTIKPHNPIFSSRNCCFLLFVPSDRDWSLRPKPENFIRKLSTGELDLLVPSLIGDTFRDMLEFGNRARHWSQILIGKSPWKWSPECDKKMRCRIQYNSKDLQIWTQSFFYMLDSIH